MARVYVSVGSNIERERNVASALATLAREYGELQQSRIYETQAVGFDGDPFYNLVVAFDSEQSPQQLAAALHRIEDRHGRVRGGDKFASRSLDLDLLLYDDLVLEQPGLVLPRPEILEYAFVLRPLAELAGDLRHPLAGDTLATLWQRFDASAQPMWPVDDAG
ncbi:MAG TPA: 2-amino-4-hydroxy-6-hydroxymethyldihydropteridine diphosphokinase [Gammaproteobacteria bacterium]|nr:2-amino-4-hydroxy-6-hydroxymethyldihydropteridine diphosphokinase [Gammaproteobacteria bacterium]